VHRSASERSHFRTRPSFWPDLTPTKISWPHLKRFKSYHADKQTYTPTNIHYWKQYHLRYVVITVRVINNCTVKALQPQFSATEPQDTINKSFLIFEKKAGKLSLLSFCRIFVTSNILMCFAGSLSQVCFSRFTEPWPSPLRMANIALKFLPARHWSATTNHKVRTSTLPRTWYDTIRYDSVYLTGSKKLTSSQLIMVHNGTSSS